MTYAYKVHGLTFGCQFPLPELMRRQVPAGSRPDLTVRHGAIDETETQCTEVPYLKLTRNAALFTFDGVGQFLVRNGHEITLKASEGVDGALLRLHLFGSIMGMACHQRGLLILHASAIAINGRAVAFAGAPGAGKSCRLTRVARYSRIRECQT
jgi:hypothetical protein